jgi:hypothetical protein
MDFYFCCRDRFQAQPGAGMGTIDLTNLDGNPAACSEIILLIALLRTGYGRQVSCGGQDLFNPLFPEALDGLFTQIIVFTQAFWGCLWETWETEDS